jgi:NADPH2:quinone reductase
MRAMVVDPAAPGRLAQQEVAVPQPGPGEALVDVRAISLNLGEVRGVAGAQAGSRPGWDLAGVVAQAATNGSGPHAGERVVGFVGSGAWAEQVAVPTNALAVLPAQVSFAQAATLPVAGLTALYATEKAGSLLGRHVLVTGASGGVGHFAVQIAKAGGGHVTGLVREAAKGDLVREAGADEVVVGNDAEPAREQGPFDLVVDAVGGATLGTALMMLAPGGIVVNFAASDPAPTTFDVRRFFPVGGAMLYGFILFDEVKRQPAAQGLTRLAILVAQGKLRPHIGVQAPWAQFTDVMQQLLNRKITGKAVLMLGEA